MQNGLTERKKDFRFAVMAALSFIIPPAVILLCFFIFGMHPFGSMLPVSSSNAAFFEDAEHLRGIVSGSSSFFYLYGRGLGAEFYSHFASGFFSLYILLISMMDNIYTAYFVYLLLSSALAGVFSFFLFSSVERPEKDGALAVSLGYSAGMVLLFGFSAPQCVQAAVLLPLVGTGIAALVDRGSIIILYLADALFMLCCSGLWVCCLVFSLVLFMWRVTMYKSKESWLLQFGLMAMCFALATGTASAVVIPILSSGIELGNAVMPFADYQSADIFSAFAGMFAGGTGDGASAALFCSVLPLIIAPLYFLNVRFTAVERVIGIVGLLLFFVSAATPFGWVLTGFYSSGSGVVLCSFVYCAFICSIASRGFSRREELRVITVILSWTVSVIALVIGIFFSGERFSVTAIVFAFGFVTMYAAVMIASRLGGRMKNAFAVFLTLCVAGECMVAGFTELKALNEKEPFYQSAYAEARGEMEKEFDVLIAKNEGSADGVFFRVRGPEGLSASTPASSALLGILGIKDGEGFTPFTDKLFSVKYTVGGDDPEKYIGTLRGTGVSSDNNVFPPAFIASSQVLELVSYSSDPFEAQNQLMSAIAGKSRNIFNSALVAGRLGNGVSLLELPEGTELTRFDGYGTVDYTVTAPVSGKMYMWYGLPYENEETVFVNGAAVKTGKMNRIVCLGSFGKGEFVNVSITVTPERFMLGNVYFASLDQALLDASVEEICQKRLTCEQKSDGSFMIGGSIIDGQVIMTTFPWQSGWNADSRSGFPAGTACAVGAFTAVTAPSGPVLFSLNYRPPDFGLSLAASAAFLVFALGLTAFIEFKRNAAAAEKKKDDILPEEEDILPPDYFPYIQEPELPPADMIYAQRYVSPAVNPPVEFSPPPQNYYQQPYYEELPDIEYVPQIPEESELPHPPPPVEFLSADINKRSQ